VKKESEKVIEEYKDVKIVANIPKAVSYEEIEPDYKTFYDFMENIKLENWKLKVDAEDSDIDYSYWLVLLESHDGLSSMYISLSSYDNKLVELSHCRIGDSSFNDSKKLYLKSGTKHQIKSDVIIFGWDYVIKYYQDRNQKSLDHIKDTINSINQGMKTLNRSNRLDDILK